MAQALPDDDATAPGDAPLGQVVDRLARAEQDLGVDHPETLQLRGRLAAALQRAGRPQVAVGVLKRNALDAERVFGAADPRTRAFHHDLARGCEAAGLFAEAARVWRSLLDHPQGPCDQGPDADDARSNLARMESALEYEDLVAELERERAAGASQTGLLPLRWRQARTAVDAGWTDKAVELWRSYWNDAQRLLGPDSPITAGSQHALAMSLIDAGRPEEALPLARQAAFEALRLLGPEDTTTLIHHYGVLQALVALGEHEEASRVGLSLYTGASRALGQDHELARGIELLTGCALNAEGYYIHHGEIRRRPVRADGAAPQGPPTGPSDPSGPQQTATRPYEGAID